MAWMAGAENANREAPSINVFKYMDYMNADIYTILKSQLGGRYGKDCYKNHINSG